MQYAVISTGGKQYKAAVGSVLEIEKLAQKEGEMVNFDHVLLVVDGESVTIGRPIVIDAVVRAKVLGDIKADKIKVVKFRAKSKYRRMTGHRQVLTRVQIEEIAGNSKPAAKQTAKKETTEKKQSSRKTSK